MTTVKATQRPATMKPMKPMTIMLPVVLIETLKNVAKDEGRLIQAVVERTLYKGLK